MIVVSERVHTGLLTPEQIIPIRCPAYDRHLIALDYRIKINNLTSRTYTHRKWSDCSFSRLLAVSPAADVVFWIRFLAWETIIWSAEQCVIRYTAA